MALAGHHAQVTTETSAAVDGIPAPPLVGGDVDQPLYERVYSLLAERIGAGIWRPGSRLPSERALSTLFGVSRLTVRRALIALEHDGLLERGEKRGWRTASGPMSEPPNELLSFTAMARSRGLTPAARVLTRDVREASINEAETLKIAPGAPVFELERLRLFDTVPIAVHRAVLPLARAPWAPDVDFTTASLHEALEEHGIRPTTAHYVIEVLDADTRLGRLLDVTVGKGLLLATGVTFAQDAVPIELGWIAHRPDRYRLRTTLVRGSRTPSRTPTTLATVQSGQG
jgi:GntR family transcriptional regulator